MPAWLKWQASSATEGTLSGKPGNLNAGSNLVRFEATDGKVVEVFEYRIQVQPLNEPPSIAAPLGSKSARSMATPKLHSFWPTQILPTP